MNNSSNGLAYQTISRDELTYVYFFVDVPGVIDGFPYMDKDLDLS